MIEKDRKKRWALLLAAVLALICCAVFLAGAESKWPAEPGKKLKKNGKLQADLTHANDGYFLAGLQKKKSKRMKLRVKKGKTTLTYDLNSDGRFEVFPFQLGNGNYEITLYENVSGKKYNSAGKLSVKVNMADTDACFYYPNQFVNYTAESPAAIRADELCDGMDSNKAYDTVCKFMKTSFVYDYVKALNIKSGVLPDIDGAYAKKMGICQDLSAIMCCMLRTRGIPARLMIGNADRNYHAWVQVRIGGEDLFFDPTAAVQGAKNARQYTIERYY